MHRQVGRHGTWILSALVGLAAVVALGGCRSAFWSPDGRTVAVDAAFKLRLFDVASRKFRTLDSAGKAVVNPTWSPDGKRLAYYGVTARDGKPESVDLWVRDAAGGPERKLAEAVVPPELAVGAEKPETPPGGKPKDPVTEVAGQVKLFLTIAWSPDGKRLAHTRTLGKEGRLEILQVETGEATLLEGDVQAQTGASWSPDGKHLAWITLARSPEPPKEPEAAGANPAPPAEPPAPPAEPPAPPAEPKDPPSEVWVGDADGRNARKVYGGGPGQARLLEFMPPMWAADSARLALFTQKPGGQLDTAFAPDVRVLTPATGKTSSLLSLSSPIGTVRPDLKAVLYIGGKDLDTVVYRTAPFKTSRLLDRLPGAGIKINPVTDDPPRPASADGGHPPTVLLSPDGKQGLLLFFDQRLKRSELRFYDLATGKKSVYPVPK